MYLSPGVELNLMLPNNSANILHAIDREIEAHEQELTGMMGSKLLSNAFRLKRTIPLLDKNGKPSEFAIKISKNSVSVRMNGREIPSTINTATYVKYDDNNRHVPRARFQIAINKTENKAAAVQLLCNTRHEIVDVEWGIKDSTLYVILGREGAYGGLFYERFILYITITTPP